MRLALVLASLALWLAFCESAARAQAAPPPSYDQWYPLTGSAAASGAPSQLRSLPPVVPAAVAPSAGVRQFEPPFHQPVAPAGHWVFVPAESVPAPASGSLPGGLAAREHPALPAPAVTDFAHLPAASPARVYDDLRASRLGPTVRIFEPKARVYFDTGWEAPDKLSLFHDGDLSASINFLELYWQHQWPQTLGVVDLPLGHPDWRWGLAVGVGISPQAAASSDGTQQSSGAPVLMLSIGLQFDFPLASAHDGNLDRLPTAGLEFGYALGVSSDESLDYIADGAIYVGVTIHVLP